MTLKVDGTNGVLQAYDYQVLTTGFNYTFAAGVQLLLAVPAGTLATGTVTMPASPVDGMNITITSTQQITALTVNANTGQSIVGGGATLLSAGGSQTFVYRLANTTWYSQNNNAVKSVATSGQVFTSTGTFTIPADVTAVKVTVVGGGGGGGGAQADGFAAGCGGGGGAAIKYLTGLTPSGTLAVTVGAGGAGGAYNGTATTGGTSSVASGTQSITTVSATGGAGGGGSAVSGIAGGLGGLGSSGDLNIAGGGGSAGNASSGAGAGGSSIFGGGASGRFAGATNAGRAYGGGGAGSSGNTSASGGAGAAGVVVFEW